MQWVWETSIKNCFTHTAVKTKAKTTTVFRIKHGAEMDGQM
jgi:hypothetical protein